MLLRSFRPYRDEELGVNEGSRRGRLLFEHSGLPLFSTGTADVGVTESEYFADCVPISGMALSMDSTLVQSMQNKKRRIRSQKTRITSEEADGQESVVRSKKSHGFPVKKQTAVVPGVLKVAERVGTSNDIEVPRSSTSSPISDSSVLQRFSPGSQAQKNPRSLASARVSRQSPPR